MSRVRRTPRRSGGATIIRPAGAPFSPLHIGTPAARCGRPGCPRAVPDCRALGPSTHRYLQHRGRGITGTDLLLGAVDLAGRHRSADRESSAPGVYGIAALQTASDVLLFTALRRHTISIVASLATVLLGATISMDRAFVKIAIALRLWNPGLTSPLRMVARIDFST